MDHKTENFFFMSPSLKNFEGKQFSVFSDDTVSLP